MTDKVHDGTFVFAYAKSMFSHGAALVCVAEQPGLSQSWKKPQSQDFLSNGSTNLTFFLFYENQ